MFLLVEHLLADLVYSQGEHGQHSRVEIYVLIGSITLCP